MDSGFIILSSPTPYTYIIYTIFLVKVIDKTHGVQVLSGINLMHIRREGSVYTLSLPKSFPYSYVFQCFLTFKFDLTLTHHGVNFSDQLPSSDLRCSFIFLVKKGNK